MKTCSLSLWGLLKLHHRHSHAKTGMIPALILSLAVSARQPYLFVLEMKVGFD